MHTNLLYTSPKDRLATPMHQDCVGERAGSWIPRRLGFQGMILIPGDGGCIREPKNRLQLRKNMSKTRWFMIIHDYPWLYPWLCHILILYIIVHILSMIFPNQKASSLAPPAEDMAFSMLWSPRRMQCTKWHWPPSDSWWMSLGCSFWCCEKSMIAWYVDNV